MRTLILATLVCSFAFADGKRPASLPLNEYAKIRRSITDAITKTTAQLKLDLKRTSELKSKDEDRYWNQRRDLIASALSDLQKIFSSDKSEGPNEESEEILARRNYLAEYWAAQTPILEAFSASGFKKASRISDYISTNCKRLSVELPHYWHIDSMNSDISQSIELSNRLFDAICSPIKIN